MKVLLHTCCAPCSIYCIETLQKENYEVSSFWYNPNIHPLEEYQKRLETYKEYMKLIKLKHYIKGEYNIEKFKENVQNDLENRCANYCYITRLEETAKFAKENGYEGFTTTLLVSPYQKHELLKEIGEKLARKYNIKFIYIDFRLGFREGQNKARELHLYRQKYCGCIYSR